MWEVAYESGPAAAIEKQIVALRAARSTLKSECPHPQELIRTSHHKFTQEWGVVTWKVDHCARCNGTIRHGDIHEE